MLRERQRIGIIGVGVVGGAALNYFENVLGESVLLYDPYKNLGSLDEVNSADVIFVCVPTPYVPGAGFDDSAVIDSLALIEPGKTVVVKSTVLPGSTERYQRLHPEHDMIFNPEFLRERTAVADFLQPDAQIVGYAQGRRAAAERVMRLLPRAPYERVLPATDAEMVKYAMNTFLAVKVSFANDLYDLCQATGADYDAVRAGFAADPRIGDSHLDVMDGGYRGYGGKCLPKDSMALLDLAASLGVELGVLSAAHEVNERLKNAPAVSDESEPPALRVA